MAAELLTFVVLAFGDSPFLEACLMSLRRQSVPVRILLSTATPSSYLERTAARFEIPYLTHRGTGRIADDWNFALELAETPYLTLAHQDDVYFPAYARACLDGLSRCPDALLAFTNYAEIQDGRLRLLSPLLAMKRAILLPFFLKPCLRSRFWRTATLAFGDPISCPSVMFHKRAIRDFRFDRALTCAIDWEAWIRLASRPGSFVFCKSPLMAHRLHPGSWTARRIRDGLRGTEELNLLCRLWPGPLARILARLYASSHKLNF